MLGRATRLCDLVAGVLWVPALSFMLALLWSMWLAAAGSPRFGLIGCVLLALVQMAMVPVWVLTNRGQALLRALMIGSMTHVAALVAEHMILVMTLRDGVSSLRYFELYRIESGMAAVLCVVAGMTILLARRSTGRAGEDRRAGAAVAALRLVGAWALIVAAISTAIAISISLIERGRKEHDRWAVAAGGTLMDSQGRLLDKDRMGAAFIVGAVPNMRLGEAMGWVFRTNELPGYEFLVMDRPRDWEGPGPDVQVILGLADTYTMRGGPTVPTILADFSGAAAESVWRGGPATALCKSMVEAYLAGTGTPGVKWIVSNP